MPRLKLTKGAIDRVAKPRTSATDVLYFDTEPKGFGLRVTPTGKATFIVQGRIGGSGKEARITIGPYGVFTPDQARDVAREHLRTMRMGTDPRDEKRQEEAMKVTLEQVCTAYVERPGKLKDSTATEVKRYVEKAFATWKDKPIASITRDMARERHREIMEGDLNGRNVFLYKRVKAKPGMQVTVCGEVNARNGYGGLTGFQQFMVSGERVYVGSTLGLEVAYLCHNNNPVIDARDYASEIRASFDAALARATGH